MVAISSDRQLDVEKTLADYNIQNKTVIDIWHKCEVATDYVFVEEDSGDRFFVFEFDDSHTVGDIKTTVKDKTGW